MGKIITRYLINLARRFPSAFAGRAYSQEDFYDATRPGLLGSPSAVNMMNAQICQTEAGMPLRKAERTTPVQSRLQLLPSLLE